MGPAQMAERGVEYTDGVARGGTNLVADGSEAPPFVLAELDGDGLSCSRKGHSGSYHTVVLCLTLHARCCHISAMQIVDVIKSTYCEKPDGFLRSRAPAPSAAFFLRHPHSLACTILRAE